MTNIRDFLWDERLSQLGVSVYYYVGTEKPYWKLVAAWLTTNEDDAPEWALQWPLDPVEVVGSRVYGRIVGDGSPRSYPPEFRLTWPTGRSGQIPESSGWASLPIKPTSYPRCVKPGPYTWCIAHSHADKLIGIGVPLGDARHISYFCVWEWRETSSEDECWTELRVALNRCIRQQIREVQRVSASQEQCEAQMKCASYTACENRLSHASHTVGEIQVRSASHYFRETQMTDAS